MPQERRKGAHGVSGRGAAVKGRSASPAAPQRVSGDGAAMDGPIRYAATIEELFAGLSPLARQVAYSFMLKRKEMTDQAPTIHPIDLTGMAEEAHLAEGEALRAIGEIGQWMVRSGTGAWMRLLTPVWIEEGETGTIVMAFMAPVGEPVARAEEAS